MQPYDRLGDSLMVWGCICTQVSRFTALAYTVLDPLVTPFAFAIGPEFLLMQDNAFCHTVTVVMDYLEQETRARSPDLIPIETSLGPARMTELGISLTEERESGRLIRSMPH